jgi:hypothetical protein
MDRDIPAFVPAYRFPSVRIPGFSQSGFECNITLNPDGMGEEGQRDLNRTEFFTLTAVDAAVRDMGKSAEMEHRI